MLFLNFCWYFGKFSKVSQLTNILSVFVPIFHSVPVFFFNKLLMSKISTLFSFMTIIFFIIPLKYINYAYPNFFFIFSQLLNFVRCYLYICLFWWFSFTLLISFIYLVILSNLWWFIYLTIRSYLNHTTPDYFDDNILPIMLSGTVGGRAVMNLMWFKFFYEQRQFHPWKLIAIWYHVVILFCFGFLLYPVTK